MMLASAIVSAIAAVGCVTDAGPSEEQTGTVSENSLVPNFECSNKNSVQVVCVGDIAILPININIKDVGVLNDSDLDILSNDLNHLSILDGGILNNNKILNDAELTVLQDFLNKFDIDVTKNDIDVCTSVLGLLLCK
jgi:hypothetical protein